MERKGNKEKNCKQCGCSFKEYAYRFDTAKFCSRKCKGDYKKGKSPSKETREKLSKALIGRKRPEEVGRKISASKKGIKRPNMAGEKHPNWKGNAKINKLVRNSIEMAQWRKDVFERDNYTCRNCGEYGGRLNADHIKEFSLIMSENKITTMDGALDCSELWSLDNGQTLCKLCHQEKTKIFINKYWKNQFGESPVYMAIRED